jgi:hypothetical protein
MAEPTRPRPQIGAALFCERVLREIDGVHTLVRVVDTFTVTPPPPGITAQPVVELNGFLLFKSGDARGKYEVRLSLTSPSGEAKPLGEPQHIVLQGGVHGAAITIHLTVNATEFGTYFLEVIVDGERLTIVPFRLRGQEEQDSDPSNS